jgi:hypothetical protein
MMRRVMSECLHAGVAVIVIESVGGLHSGYAELSMTVAPSTDHPPAGQA